MEDFLLAKSDGTTLKQHTIDVVNSTKDCLRGKVSDKILKIAMVAAAIHDCGKTMPSFQEYIKLNDNERSAKDNAYDGPYPMCIPYEKNEHLFGTTQDCDTFYKNW